MCVAIFDGGVWAEQGVAIGAGDFRLIQNVQNRSVVFVNENSHFTGIYRLSGRLIHQDAPISIHNI